MKLGLQEQKQYWWAFFCFQPTIALKAQVYSPITDYDAVRVGAGGNGKILTLGGLNNGGPIMWYAYPRTAPAGGGEQYKGNSRAAKIQYEPWGERLRIQLSDVQDAMTTGTPVTWNDVLVLGNNGNVGIGTLDCSNYRLAVEGKIGCRELLVTTDSWCDFVFDETIHSCH
jgi:hypothetical protein